MAIQDAFNISQARTNQAYAYKCWYNYNYENNTMGIPSSAMGEIVTQYKGVLENWKATATNDENKYEISDDDFSKAVDKGFEDTAKKTGYEGNGKTGMVLRGVVDGALGLVGAVGSTIASKAVGRFATQNIVKPLKMAAVAEDGQLATNIQKNGSHDSKSAHWIITAPLALATGTLYQSKKPNREQYEAAMELLAILPEQQANAAQAQQDMQDADDELIAMQEDAEETNDATNDEIEENKSEFDLYKESYDALIQKVEQGVALTDEEKELLKALVPLMQQLGEDINTLSEDTVGYIQDLYADMEDYQDYYDAAADTIANILGVTDYGDSFLQTAQIMMYVEAGAQGLNVASGTKASIQAGKFAASGGWLTAWAWAFVGMGAGGAVMSGLGMKEQLEWAGKTGSTIEMNDATKELNDATKDVYDERIEDYEGYMGTVGDLELEIPDDMEAPEEVPEIPEGSETDDNQDGTRGATNGTTQNGTTQNGQSNPKTTDIGQTDDYSAVMGYGADYAHVIRGDMPMEQGTVLVNNKNKVVLSKSYADAITAVTGDTTGKRFSTEKIPNVIASLLPDPFDAKMIKDVLNGKKLDSEYSAKLMSTLEGEEKGSTTVDNSDKATQLAKKVIDFYYPIFKGAASMGWSNGVVADMDNLKKVNIK